MTRMSFDFRGGPWLAVILAIIVSYPYTFSLLEALVCQHDGTLSTWNLRCECPAVYADGADCSTCQVPSDKGTCGYNAAARHGYGALCKNKCYVPMCTECYAQCINPVDGVCSDCIGACDNKNNWYENPSTGACTVSCKDATRCNGHGKCTAPYGECECDDGYASIEEVARQYGPRCDVACPNLCTVNGVKRGDCQANGVCHCFEGFAGPGCEKVCPRGTNGQPCSGHGYCGFDGKCQCYMQQSTAKQLYVGDQCQFACPIERGVICNNPKADCVAGTAAALCNCPGSVSSQVRVCDCNCHGHGQCETNGCVCKTGYDSSTDCTTCLPFFMSKSTGCSHYCDPDVTCMGRGTCKQLASGDVICGGDRCKNFDRRVTNYFETLLNPPMLIVAGESGTVTVQETTSFAQYFMQANRVGSETQYNFTVSGSINFKNTSTFSLVDPIYTSVQSGVIAQMYTARLIPDGQCAGAASFEETCTKCATCAGYVVNGNQVSYLSCLEKSTYREAKCGPTGQRLTDLIRVPPSQLQSLIIRKRNNDITLQNGQQYVVHMQRATPRGCNKCRPNYYPSVEYATAHNMTPCSTFCDARKCSYFGTCSDAGQCVCVRIRSHT